MKKWIVTVSSGDQFFIEATMDELLEGKGWALATARSGGEKPHSIRLSSIVAFTEAA
jgi:hypothetical protein